MGEEGSIFMRQKFKKGKLYAIKGEIMQTALEHIFLNCKVCLKNGFCGYGNQVSARCFVFSQVILVISFCWAIVSSEFDFKMTFNAILFVERVNS